RWVDTLVDRAGEAGGGVAVASPKEAGEPRIWGSAVLNSLVRHVPGFYSNPGDIFYPERRSVLFPRFLLPEGPFDPDYFVFEEDVFLGWKLRLQGRGAFRSLGAKVFQEEGRTSARLSSWRTDFYKSRNRWLNLIVFFEKTTLVKILPWLLADIVFRWWTALLTDWPAWWGMTLSLGWLAAHPKAVFQKRLSLQKKRTVRDREILPCISGRIAGDGGAFKRIL